MEQVRSEAQALPDEFMYVVHGNTGFSFSLLVRYVSDKEFII